MKQEYSVPELEIVILGTYDVITASGDGGDVVNPDEGWWNPQ